MSNLPLRSRALRAKFEVLAKVLSRIVPPRSLLCIAFLALTTPIADANSITFEVTGTAFISGTFVTGPKFIMGLYAVSGTLTVDVTAGEVTAVDISVPIMGPDFTNLTSSAPDCSFSCGWEITATNGTSPVFIPFHTTRPGSLIDFVGGPIILGQGIAGSNNFGFFPQSGKVTPAGATPILPTLPLFASGLGAMAFLARRRKRTKASAFSAPPSSAL